MAKPSQPVVLVTGASGMLGLKLCQVLAKKGFRVVAGYHGDGTLLEKAGVPSAQFDLTFRDSVQSLKGELPRLDAIVHCAAMTDVNQCELDKKRCLAVNIMGTKHIAELARHFDASLIYISTPMIFSGTKGNYTERSRPEPLNYYSKSKLMGEREALKYKKSLVLRANPIGVRPPGAHPSFIQWFVQTARGNTSFSLFSDVRINPISTQTLSELIIKLITSFKPGILHLGSKDIVNKADVWDVIVSRFPMFSGTVTRVPANATAAGRVARRPTEMWLNTSKAQKMGYRMPGWRKELLLVLKELHL